MGLSGSGFGQDRVESRSRWRPGPGSGSGTTTFFVGRRRLFWSGEDFLSSVRFGKESMYSPSSLLGVNPDPPGVLTFSCSPFSLRPVPSRPLPRSTSTSGPPLLPRPRRRRPHGPCPRPSFSVLHTHNSPLIVDLVRNPSWCGVVWFRLWCPGVCDSVALRWSPGRGRVRVYCVRGGLRSRSDSDSQGVRPELFSKIHPRPVDEGGHRLRGSHTFSRSRVLLTPSREVTRVTGPTFPSTRNRGSGSKVSPFLSASLTAFLSGFRRTVLP